MHVLPAAVLAQLAGQPVPNGARLAAGDAEHFLAAGRNNSRVKRSNTVTTRLCSTVCRYKEKEVAGGKTYETVLLQGCKVAR